MKMGNVITLSGLRCHHFFSELQFLVQEYKQFLEEAKKYDHRLLGIKQELFFCHPLRCDMGSCILLISIDCCLPWCWFCIFGVFQSRKLVFPSTWNSGLQQTNAIYKRWVQKKRLRRGWSYKCLSRSYII
jgi:hypothetical protein